MHNKNTLHQLRCTGTHQNKKDSNFFLQRFFVSPSMIAKLTILAQTWCVYTTSGKSAIFNLQRSFFCWIIKIFANIQRSGYDYRRCYAPRDLEQTITKKLLLPEQRWSRTNNYRLTWPEFRNTIKYQYGDCDKSTWVGTKIFLWYWSHTVDHRWYHLCTDMESVQHRRKPTM